MEQEKTEFYRPFSLLGFLVVLALCVASVSAQIEKGAFTGLVTDPTGAVLPGATVTIKNLGTGEVRTTITGADGLYRASGLSPGAYELSAELSGFKKVVDTNVRLLVGETKRVDFRLELGEITEVVTVTGEAAAVDTEQGRVSSVIETREIESLPLNGRNVYQLIRLAPGAVSTTGITFYGGEAGGFGGSPSADTVVNGVRQEFNGFLMDGVTNRNFGTAGAMFTPSVDAVSEFRIETANFSAEFGEAGAFITNLATRSGTNEFHGSAWQFHRNDNLDASNFFDPFDDKLQKKVKPEFKWNQFGFTAGGPILRDKFFAFGYYEGFRLRTASSKRLFAETPEFRNFVIGNFPDSVAAFLMRQMPAPAPSSPIALKEYANDFSGFGYDCQRNCGQAVAETLTALARNPRAGIKVPAELISRFAQLPDSFPMAGNIESVIPNTQTTDQFMVRLDHSWNEGNDKVMGRYSFLRSSQGEIFQPQTPRPLSSSISSTRAQNFAFTQTHILSPTTINEFRFGFARLRDDIIPKFPGIPLLGFDSGEVEFGAYNGFPQLFRDEVFEWRDILSINRGKHGLKAGIEFRRRREPSEFNVARPSYQFFDMFWFAVDAPYLQIAGVDPGVEISRDKPVTAASPKVRPAQLQSNIRDWRSLEFSWFFNDDFKLHPRFTLNLGIRYDLYGRLHEGAGRGTQFVQPEAGSIFEKVVASPGFISMGKAAFANRDPNNFAPRFGFAWDPFGDGKMSVRGGYGIAYQSMFFNPLANSRWQLPWYSFNIIFPIFGSGNSIIYGPPPGEKPRFDGPSTNIGQGGVAPGNLMGWDPANPNLAFLTGIQPIDSRDPYVQSFFFGIQRELLAGLVVETNWVSTKGTKIIRAEDPNRFPGDRAGFPNPLTGANAGDRGLNRLNPNFGTLRFWLNDVNSSYHALQLGVKKTAGSWQFNADYTLGKAIDTRSGWHNSSVTANGRADGFGLDPYNFKATERGPATFDIRHKFSLNWTWEIPFLKQQASALGKLLGGWELSGIVAVQSGAPFTVFCTSSFPTCDWNADGWNNDRPVPLVQFRKPTGPHSYINGGIFDIDGDGKPNRTIDNKTWKAPDVGTVSPLGRNTARGPGFAGVDFAAIKNFRIASISEAFRIQFRAEFFNIFNRVNFLLAESAFRNMGNIASSTFGEATEAFNSRQIQFGLKIIW